MNIKTADNGIRYIVEANLGVIDVTLLQGNDRPGASFSFESFSQAIDWLETLEPIEVEQPHYLK